MLGCLLQTREQIVPVQVMADTDRNPRKTALGGSGEVSNCDDRSAVAHGVGDLSIENCTVHQGGHTARDGGADPGRHERSSLYDHVCP